MAFFLQQYCLVVFYCIHLSYSHPESFLAGGFVYKRLDSISQKKKWFLKGNDKECQFPAGKWIHL